MLHRFYLLRLDKRLVALNIDNDIISAAYFGISLIATVGATFMVYRSHDSLSAKSFNCIEYPFIVGSYTSIIEYAAHPIVYSFYNGLSTQHSQWLSRKARRSIACRYYSYKFHF